MILQEGRDYIYAISGVIAPLVFIVSISFFLIGGCGGSGSSGGGDQGFSFSFTDVTESAGFLYSHSFIGPLPVGEPQLISGGVAAGDFDNDGWVDLYAVGGPGGTNLLFKNIANGTFQDVAPFAGVALTGEFGSGPAFADYDGDGFLDLFIGAVTSEPVRFFRNNGDSTFEEVTDSILDSTITRTNTFSITFGDYDLDGDLDFFLSHWASGTVGSGDSSQHLWRNNGNGTFTDASIDSGITAVYAPELDYSFSPNFSDINNDGLPDLLIAADFGTSKVFINQGDGTFSEITNAVITDENGMGAAVGDYDNDGDMDWFVSSIYDPDMQSEGNWGITGNRLYRNTGNGLFEDVTVQAGVDHGFWGWGSCFADFNNDGHLDLTHVNGFGFSEISIPTTEFFADPTRLFISNGDGTFTERALELNLDDTGMGRGIVCFDYDRDGDIDIFIANNNQPPKLYRNDGGNQNNFITIKLNGLPPNTEAIGARITLIANGITQTSEIHAGSNFVSQNPAIAHFGLEKAEIINTIHVDWPDGATSLLEDVSPNQFLEIPHP